VNISITGNSNIDLISVVTIDFCIKLAQMIHVSYTLFFQLIWIMRLLILIL